MQNDVQNSLCEVALNYIPDAVIKKRNKERSWKYGYDLEQDVVVISRDGTVGKVLKISGLYIALPSQPKNVFKRDKKHSLQYWEQAEIPKAMKSIPTIFAWNEMPKDFKETWIPYI